MTAPNPSPRALLGCIADDFTGATDLANTLVRNGMRTVQTIGVPAGGEALRGVEQADALVVALKSRTIPAADAIAQSLAALRWLQVQGCRQFFFKYCSTFDSTDAGNIGPVAEALLAALGSDFTIACPAFPENGRTIFRGHLFVGDALLNESGMESHPLTPMRDASLVRVLQRQSQGKVGLVRYDSVARGSAAAQQAMAALRSDGVRLAIADAVSDADLHALGEACSGLPLLTGGSGLAL
ncbi:four-carbon acid sugar kinase family protein, partial [Cupriavidus basilensis]